MVPKPYPLWLDLDINFQEIVFGFKSEGQKNYEKNIYDDTNNLLNKFLTLILKNYFSHARLSLTTR